MLMMVLSSALLSGISVSLVKFFGEMIQSASAADGWFFVVLLLVLAFLVSIVQMHMLANAMKYYDYMEVQPIY